MRNRAKSQELKMDDFNKKEKVKNILYFIGFILLLLWTSISLVQTIIDPPTADDLTVEERIRYERMIFP